MYKNGLFECISLPFKINGKVSCSYDKRYTCEHRLLVLTTNCESPSNGKELCFLRVTSVGFFVSWSLQLPGLPLSRPGTWRRTEHNRENHTLIDESLQLYFQPC